MPRRRTKGLIPVLLLILAVAVFGRVRSKPEREAPSAGSPTPIPQAPADPPRRHDPAPVRPKPARPDNKLTAKVVGVHDGDTITVLTDEREQIKVRLDAIDAPELGQAYGQASKKALSGLVFGKEVTVVAKKIDRYGRTIGHVIVDGGDVNLLMLEMGMAWHYREYDSNRRLQQAEDDARTARRGLWADPSPTPPWEWRKERRDRG